MVLRSHCPWCRWGQGKSLSLSRSLTSLRSLSCLKCRKGPRPVESFNFSLYLIGSDSKWFRIEGLTLLTTDMPHVQSTGACGWKNTFQIRRCNNAAKNCKDTASARTISINCTKKLQNISRQLEMDRVLILPRITSNKPKCYSQSGCRQLL